MGTCLHRGLCFLRLSFVFAAPPLSARSGASCACKALSEAQTRTRPGVTALGHGMPQYCRVYGSGQGDAFLK